MTALFGPTDAIQRAQALREAGAAGVAAHIRGRVDGVSTRLCRYQPGPVAVDALAQIVDALNA